MEQTHRLLQRNMRDCKIGGVAAGLGDYFGVDPTIVRLAFVLLVVAGGIGLVAYLVAWLVMPAGDGSTDSVSPSQTGSSTDGRSILGAVILSVGLLGLIGWAGIWWFDGFAFWALAFVAVGVALLLWRRDDGGPPPPGAPGPHDAPHVTPPAPESPSEDKTQDDSPDENTRTTRSLGAPPRLPVEPIAQRRFPIGWITLGAILASAAVASGLDATGALDVSARWFLVFALGLATVGLVAGALYGRVRGPVSLAVVLGVALGLAWLIDVPLHGGVGDRTVRPLSTAELANEYRLGVGKLVLDLRALDLGSAERHVEAGVGVGQLVVLVPPGTETDVTGRASVGEVELYHYSEGGIDVDTSIRDGRAILYPERRYFPSPLVSSPGHLVLDLEVGVGKVEARQSA